MKPRLKFLVIIAISLVACLCIFNAKTALATPVTISGRQIFVDGVPFTTKGVGYAPVPICIDPETTSPYGDYFTSDYSSIYTRDMPLLRQMGANTIRLWGWNNAADHTDFLNKAYNNGTNPIYVVVTFWMDYPDITSHEARAKIKADFKDMVAAHKNYSAVLMWAIGNELNAPWMYGDKLDDLFSLINEMAQEAHLEEGENAHPVTTPLADIDLINTIATYDSAMSHLDAWSVQVYRGPSFGSLFSDYAAVSAKPLAILEYGIDAYDTENCDEYENVGIPYQATYAEALWKEIEANSDVCFGGSIMAYSDEWWKGKYGQASGCPDSCGCPDYDPGCHSKCGYPIDSHPDGFSNEEWWGIMRTIDNGSAPDIMQPRAVYYTLQSLWYISPPWPEVYKSVLGESKENNLKVLRSFRDKILIKNPIGKRYVNQLYENSFEVALNLLLNPGLRVRTAEILEPLIPRFQSIIKGEQMSLHKTEVDEIKALLDNFGKGGSPQFRGLIWNVKRDLNSEKFLNNVGIILDE